MFTGRMSARWAQQHHPLWVEGEDEPVSAAASAVTDDHAEDPIG
jgi:cytochrome b subunit of formate dehydrogenase